MLIVGIMTALVAVCIDICIEQLASWKYNFLHGCILINIPSLDFERRGGREVCRMRNFVPPLTKHTIERFNMVQYMYS